MMTVVVGDERLAKTWFPLQGHMVIIVLGLPETMYFTESLHFYKQSPPGVCPVVLVSSNGKT